MFASADLRRSLTAKVLLGLMLLGLCVVAIYSGVRLLNIKSSITEREGARAQLLAEPMRFALESLAERHPEITTQTERLQRLLEHMAKTTGLTSMAVMDASGRRALAATGNPKLLRGAGADLPQRTLSLNRPIAEGAPEGEALLIAMPLHRPAAGGSPSEAFGV
ncbi:MAG: hypothetical protein Q8S17_12680, partial [Humidesulfovibrio sp.]|nr:hypothetical protein [Humidesulfovibrio sp.]